MTVESEMTAVVADAFGGLAKLRVAKVPVPVPKRGQVLVRIHAAPCNPADILYLENRYGIDRPLPATPGFEGSGVVVASGGGLLGRWLVGKRVSCGGHECSGTWAEYCVVDAAACLPLAKDLTFEQGAAALANPTTALALAQVVARGGHRAYVQSAAAGQLGKMIAVALRERGIPGIHVVRRAAQADALRALGESHVLDSTAPDFDRDLAALAAKLHATIALDAVAGAMTGHLLQALPHGGEVVVYGALSAEPCGGMDPMALAFGDKRVRGFEIAGYLREQGLLRSFRLARAAQARVRSGVFTTTIAERTSLADAPTKLPAYGQHMSDGKILIELG
jgi:NADPH:quinone reductase-like Zn-dependent oxidoreductase